MNIQEEKENYIVHFPPKYFLLSFNPGKSDLSLINLFH